VVKTNIFNYDVSFDPDVLLTRCFFTGAIVILLRNWVESPLLVTSFSRFFKRN
jgi:hypothetical protein